jgi:asparagine synthase (glutamine-hydrolysing)
VPDPVAVLRTLAHRGPDGAAHLLLPLGFLGFTRLSLVGAAPQPMQEGGLALVCNGEIYNHAELRLSLPGPAPLSVSASDCSILLPCVAAWGVAQCVQRLQGMFALALVVSSGETQDVYLARDRMGIKPLVWGVCAQGRCLYFASEACALPPTWRVQDVEAGHLLHFRVSPTQAVEVVSSALFMPPWTPAPQRHPVTGSALRAALVASVSSHLMGDHPVGVFLSGGLDSSLLAAIAARHYRQRSAVLKTFTISHSSGASADLEFARRTAAFLGAAHTPFTFTTAEALAALKSIVLRLETYDVGLVRVAVPFYLLAEKVASLGCRAVLVGEGSDEVFAGYALFRSFGQDSVPAFQREVERRLACISASELLRVDRCTMAFGLEARVPFLDANFLSLAMHDSCTAGKLSHSSTGCLEKYTLRQAFEGWLPCDVLYRRKEGMADGVGFEWVREVQQEASRLEGVADFELAEASLYRRLFCDGVHPSRVALAEARIAARNAHRPTALAHLINGSAFIRQCKTVDSDPQLSSLFTLRETAEFCSSKLGVEVAAQAPTLHLLNSLIEAVVQRVPFHNFALLTRPRTPPTPKEVRDDWLGLLGGTCAYTSPAFASMLCTLGFQVQLVAAAVRREFDHLALLVLLEGRFYYVDIGNGKRYLEAAPLGDERPLGTSFLWRLQWSPEASLFHVFHGKRAEDGGAAWEHAPSITFCPNRSVHYSFFHEHFALARLNQHNIFLHGLRFAVFPGLTAEVSVRDAHVTLGAIRVRTASEAALLTFAQTHMNSAHVQWLVAALGVLRVQGDDLWAAVKG